MKRLPYIFGMDMPDGKIGWIYKTFVGDYWLEISQNCGSYVQNTSPYWEMV